MVKDVITPKEGKEGKTRWVKIGVAFENDNKQTRILLDAAPYPDKNGDVVMVLVERIKKDV